MVAAVNIGAAAADAAMQPSVLKDNHKCPDYSPKEIYRAFTTPGDTRINPNYKTNLRQRKKGTINTRKQNGWTLNAEWSGSEGKEKGIWVIRWGELVHCLYNMLKHRFLKETDVIKSGSWFLLSSKVISAHGCRGKMFPWQRLKLNHGWHVRLRREV